MHVKVEIGPCSGGAWREVGGASWGLSQVSTGGEVVFFSKA